VIDGRGAGHFAAGGSAASSRAISGQPSCWCVAVSSSGEAPLALSVVPSRRSRVASLTVIVPPRHSTVSLQQESFPVGHRLRASRPSAPRTAWQGGRSLQLPCSGGPSVSGVDADGGPPDGDVTHIGGRRRDTD
jgi:hypothetical protein